MALEALCLEALATQMRNALAAAGNPTPGTDARLLLQEAGGYSSGAMILRADQEVPVEIEERARDFLARRLGGEPVHRILGHRDFYGLRLVLAAQTLEPRPDTETLVDLALPFLTERAAAGAAPRILDLGTGTGAIALALLSQCGTAEAIGTDISEEALAAAERNAAANGLVERFRTAHGSWFEAVEGPFDLIVSNPPYITRTEIAALSVEVRDHDPLAALDGGTDGLDAYRAIAAGVRGHLKSDGALALEIGAGQRGDVEALIRGAGLDLADTKADLGGIERALLFKMGANAL